MRNHRSGPAILIGTKRRHDGQPQRDRLGNPHTFRDPILDAESWATSQVEKCLQKLGMYIHPAEKEEFIGDALELLFKLERQFDPAKNSSFAGYAAWIVPRRLIDIIPRALLGRNGGRIAQRSHEELTEQTHGGNRHLTVVAEEPGDLSQDRAANRGWLAGDRDRLEAWADAELGIRAA